MNIGLNPAQKKAVETLIGPVLVLAGAGTGKTRVIIARIVHLLSQGIPPQNILAVTFTKKAACEMQERLITMVGRVQAMKVFVSTFHALGATILKSHADRLGFRKPFSIYDQSESVGVLRKMLKEEFSEWKPPVPVSELLSWLSVHRLNRFSKTWDAEDSNVERVCQNYQRHLKNCNAVDFDDLLYLPIELFNKHPDVLQQYRQKFRFLLIDEFQDTNAPQFDLAKKLTGSEQNICVVGDDDQAIYGFRGSDSKHILHFEKYFKNATVVKLEDNYRSTQIILKAANALIQNNSSRHQKCLRSQGGIASKITLICARNEREEAMMVVSSIFAERFQNTFAMGDMAILYRAHSQSRALEEELITKKIPYHLVGGVKFFERKEIKDVLSYLKVISNPLDETAMYRIVNCPPRGIGQTSLETINAFCKEKHLRFYEGLLRAEEIAGLGDSVLASIKIFLKILGDARASLKIQPLSAVIEKLLKDSNYPVEIRRHHTQEKEIQEKMENCMGLVLSARDYENDPENLPGTLEGFLEKILFFTEDEISNPAKKKTDRGKHSVKLMSLHNSKGLEFPYVSIIGVNEKILPHEKSIHSEKNLEEERRLFYVGITRARKKLNLSYLLSKSNYGKEIALSPSRFLKELPEECLEDMKQRASDEEAGHFFSRIKKEN
jgi:superfamily I DNA/RNA helicase